MELNRRIKRLGGEITEAQDLEAYAGRELERALNDETVLPREKEEFEKARDEAQLALDAHKDKIEKLGTTSNTRARNMSRLEKKIADYKILIEDRELKIREWPNTVKDKRKQLKERENAVAGKQRQLQVAQNRAAELAKEIENGDKEMDTKTQEREALKAWLAENKQ